MTKKCSHKRTKQMKEEMNYVTMLTNARQQTIKKRKVETEAFLLFQMIVALLVFSVLSSFAIYEVATKTERRKQRCCCP